MSSNQASKEQIAKEIARGDKVERGLIVILSAVEPCQSYSVRGQRQTKEIHLVLEVRKCLFFYYYFLYPIFGFMHARVQSWFPFTVDFCLNGREWLAKQLARAGIGYRRRENCFTAIDDWRKAQPLANRQLQTDWPKTLSAILDRVLCTTRLRAYWPAILLSIPQSKIRSSHFRNNEARATLPVKQLKATKLVLR